MAVKRLKSPLTDAGGKLLLLTNSTQGILKGGRRTKTPLVYHEGRAQDSVGSTSRLAGKSHSPEERREKDQGEKEGQAFLRFMGRKQCWCERSLSFSMVGGP